MSDALFTQHLLSQLGSQVTFDEPGSISLAMMPLNAAGTLSYEDYFLKIEDMVRDMRANWQLGQRVQALKVVIQLTKLLAYTDQLKLYSRKYHRIISALDEFGDFVIARIHQIPDAESTEQQSPGESPANQSHKINELARQTASNWLLKISTIRELVPRFFLEVATLDLCRYVEARSVDSALNNSQIRCQLERLSRVAWGFGDPIVGLHARAYLCKVATRLLKLDSDHSVTKLIEYNLDVSITLLAKTSEFNALGRSHSKRVDLVFELVANRVQFILDTLTDRFSDSLVEQYTEEKLKLFFKNILGRLDSTDEILQKNLIFYTLVKTFPFDIVAHHSQELLSAVVDIFWDWKRQNPTKDVGQTFFSSIRAYLVALDGSDAFEASISSDQKYEIFKHSLEIIDYLSNEDSRNSKFLSQSYGRCFKAVLSYATHHVAPDVFEPMLSDFVIKIEAKRLYIDQQQFIVDLLKVLFSNKVTVDDFRVILCLKPVKRLQQLLRRADLKLEMAQWLLEAMRSAMKLLPVRSSSESDDGSPTNSLEITDGEMIETLFGLFSTINSHCNLPASTEHADHLSSLIIFFLERIPAAKGPNQLDFLAKCRASCTHLDKVLEYLVKGALGKARHDTPKCSSDGAPNRRKKQTLKLVKTCLTFSFVTVAFIESDLLRLSLYIDISELALSHRLELQAACSIGHSISTLKRLIAPMNPTEQLSNFAQSKTLQEQIENLFKLISEHQECVGMKHKRVFANLIIQTFNEQTSASFAKDLKLLNLATDSATSSSVTEEAGYRADNPIVGDESTKYDDEDVI